MSLACERCDHPAEQLGFCPRCGGAVLNLSSPADRAWRRALQGQRRAQGRRRRRGTLLLAALLGGLTLFVLEGLTGFWPDTGVSWSRRHLSLAEPLCGGFGGQLRSANLRVEGLCLRRVQRLELTGSTLDKADLRGARPRRGWLRQVTLRRPRLEGADLSDLWLDDLTLLRPSAAGLVKRGGDVGGLRVEGGVLDGANFNRARGRVRLLRDPLWGDLSAKRLSARRASLSDSLLVGVDLRGADLEDASLAWSVLKDLDLRGASLVALDLKRARLLSVQLAGADLRGAGLEEADLRGVDFSEVRGLESARFSAALVDAETRWPSGFAPEGVLAIGPGASLARVDLMGREIDAAELRDADLRGCSCQRVQLLDADLRGADLRGAKLRGARLRGADLRGADLRGADLQNAYLRGAQLEGAQLADADLRGAWLGEPEQAQAERDGALYAPPGLFSLGLPQP
ncbi:MAG: pentapeptide repeat-containing protein [Alphaproteobacteria bacterium]|nr:pentapeptide repeat-containing protein [Alphaproteobacteria bacterium]